MNPSATSTDTKWDTILLKLTVGGGGGRGGAMKNFVVCTAGYN